MGMSFEGIGHVIVRLSALTTTSCRSMRCSCIIFLPMLHYLLRRANVPNSLEGLRVCVTIANVGRGKCWFLETIDKCAQLFHSHVMF